MSADIKIVGYIVTLCYYKKRNSVQRPLRTTAANSQN